MSSLLSIYNELSRQPGFLRPEETSRALEGSRVLSTEYDASFIDFQKIAICRNQAATDRLSSIFRRDVALLGEFRHLHAFVEYQFEHLTPISEAMADVQAYLGLMWFVSQDDTSLDDRLNMLIRVVARAQIPRISPREPQVVNFLEKRWPGIAREYPKFIGPLANRLLRTLDEKDISFSANGTLPLGVIRSFLDEVGSVLLQQGCGHIMDALRKAEDSCEATILHQATDPKLFHATQMCKRFAATSRAPLSPAIRGQFEEAVRLMPKLSMQGLAFRNLTPVRRLSPSNQSGVMISDPDQVNLVDLMEDPLGRQIVRKTYMTRDLTDRGVFCSGLANTMRFSEALGTHSAELLGVDLDNDGRWVAYLRYEALGDVWDLNNNNTFSSCKPEEVSVWMAIALLTPLAEAHRRKIIFQDFKPFNVLVHDANSLRNITCVLTDSDISLREREAPHHRSLPFRTGTFVPLEALEKEYVPNFTTDVYAAGVSLYSMILKRVPPIFRSGRYKGTREVDLNHIAKGHPLRPVIENAVRDNPMARHYPDARAMLEHIQTIARQLPSHTAARVKISG